MGFKVGEFVVEVNEFLGKAELLLFVGSGRQLFFHACEHLLDFAASRHRVEHEGQGTGVGHAHERRLARTVAADQADPVFLADAQVNAVEESATPEPNLQAFGCYK